LCPSSYPLLIYPPQILFPLDLGTGLPPRSSTPDPSQTGSNPPSGSDLFPDSLRSFPSMVPRSGMEFFFSRFFQPSLPESPSPYPTTTRLFRALDRHGCAPALVFSFFFRGVVFSHRPHPSSLGLWTGPRQFFSVATGIEYPAMRKTLSPAAATFSTDPSHFSLLLIVGFSGPMPPP